MASKAELLIGVLEPIAQQHDLDLVDVEVAGTTKNPILRVFLDTFAGGINLDQLAEAQAWVDEAVEKIDPFKCSYMLEVSSPGIDRPLRRLSDFEAYTGEEAVIYLKAGEARTKVQGIIVGTDGDGVIIQSGEDEENIPLSRIKKANVIGKIDFSSRKFDELEDVLDDEERE